jgi:hypothetical protein
MTRSPVGADYHSPGGRPGLRKMAPLTLGGGNGATMAPRRATLRLRGRLSNGLPSPTVNGFSSFTHRPRLACPATCRARPEWDRP